MRVPGLFVMYLKAIIKYIYIMAVWYIGEMPETPVFMRFPGLFGWRGSGVIDKIVMTIFAILPYSRRKATIH